MCVFQTARTDEMHMFDTPHSSQMYHSSLLTPDIICMLVPTSLSLFWDQSRSTHMEPATRITTIIPPGNLATRYNIIAASSSSARMPKLKFLTTWDHALFSKLEVACPQFYFDRIVKLTSII